MQDGPPVVDAAARPVLTVLPSLLSDASGDVAEHDDCPKRASMTQYRATGVSHGEGGVVFTPEHLVLAMGGFDRRAVPGKCGILPVGSGCHQDGNDAPSCAGCALLDRPATIQSGAEPRVHKGYESLRMQTVDAVFGFVKDGLVDAVCVAEALCQVREFMSHQEGG